MNNMYNPNAMNTRSPVPVNNSLQNQNGYTPYGLNEFLYNNRNNNNYYNNNTLPNNDQFFKCKPVSSKAEAAACPIDLNGSLWVFVDIGNSKIYTKQIQESGKSEFKVYALTVETAEEPSSEYVTKTEFNNVIQALMASMQPKSEQPINTQNKTAPLNF